jgi:hypothetical protein
MSKVKFWKPEDCYRKGVEDATKPVQLGAPSTPVFVSGATFDLNMFLKERREALLTKALPTGEDLSALIHKICRKVVDEGRESLSETEIQIMGAFALGVNSSVSPVKKVTKWIRVYQTQKELYPAAGFFDSKEEADTLQIHTPGGPFVEDPEYCGAYPVEIKVPL